MVFIPFAIINRVLKFKTKHLLPVLKLIGNTLNNSMAEKVKSGKEILDDFFDDIEELKMLI